jgi:hypothetical protein
MRSPCCSSVYLLQVFQAYDIVLLSMCAPFRCYSTGPLCDPLFFAFTLRSSLYKSEVGV